MQDAAKQSAGPSSEASIRDMPVENGILPNFLVIGAQKAATTSLHHYLVQHPQIYLPEQKETKFFVLDELYSRGLDFYRSEHFGAWSGETAVGEVDPDYMYFGEVAGRVAASLDVSKLKIIVLLRNPVDRAFSHYLMTHRRGIEPLSFAAALEAETQRLQGGDFESRMHYSYADRGKYIEQLEAYVSLVGRANVLVLLTEDLEGSPVEAMCQVFTFLGVNPGFQPEGLNVRFHQAMSPRSMWLLQRIRGQGFEKRLFRALFPFRDLRHRLRANLLKWNLGKARGARISATDRRKLTECFRPYNDRLARFLERDLGHWSHIE